MSIGFEIYLHVKVVYIVHSLCAQRKINDIKPNKNEFHYNYKMSF